MENSSVIRELVAALKGLLDTTICDRCYEDEVWDTTCDCRCHKEQERARDYAIAVLRKVQDGGIA